MTEFSEGTLQKLESLTERNEKCAADVSKTEDDEQSPHSKDLLSCESSLDGQIEIDGMKTHEHSIPGYSRKHGPCEAAAYDGAETPKGSDDEPAAKKQMVSRQTKDPEDIQTMKVHEYSIPGYSRKHGPCEAAAYDGAETSKGSNDEPAAKKQMVSRQTKDPEDIQTMKCLHDTLDDEMSRFYREIEQVSRDDEIQAQEGIGLRLSAAEAGGMSERNARRRCPNGGDERSKKNLGYQLPTKDWGNWLDPYGKTSISRAGYFPRFRGHLDHWAPTFLGAGHSDAWYRGFGTRGHPEDFLGFSRPQAACTVERYADLEGEFRQQSHCGRGKGFHGVWGDCHGGDVRQESKGLNGPLKDKQSSSVWPVKELYLIRGLPGSGKSTFASWLCERGPNGIICSTDDFFRSADGKYCYDKMRLSEAHCWNQDKAERAMACGRSPVIIDNTNTQAWEMKPYVSQALDLSYHIRFVEPDTWWKTNTEELEKRNSHGVDRFHIQSMLSRFERNVSVDSVLRSQIPIRKSQKAKT